MLLDIILLMLCAILMSMSSFVLGVQHKRIQDAIAKLNNDFTNHTKEEQEDDESQIVETTPEVIRDKVRKGETPGDDSAIVITKSPQEIRKAKDAELNERLDKLGR